jgi:hypothetical protein
MISTLPKCLLWDRVGTDGKNDQGCGGPDSWLGILRGAFIRLQRASQLQCPFAEPIRDAVKGFQQTIVLFSFPRLLEKLGLNRLGFLPVADAHADEPHWLARQFAVKKEFPSLS